MAKMAMPPKRGMAILAMLDSPYGALHNANLAAGESMNHNNMLKVFSGRANVPLAEKISQCLGDSLGKITLQNFPDGESWARIDEDVRGHEL